jgi:hypothetical protein
MMPNDKLELCNLLNADEMSALLLNDQEIEDHTVVTLPTHRMQVSRPLEDGSSVLLLHIHVPAGLFQDGSRILQANGEPKSNLEGAVVVPPQARCVVRIDRLSTEAREQFDQKLEMVAQEVSEMNTSAPPA